MPINDRTALHSRYQWFFLRYPRHLVRPLVVSDRVQQREEIYSGIGEKLRLEICAVKCTTFEEFCFGINEIHKTVGNFLTPRRCTAFCADGSKLMELGIHHQNKVLFRCRKFDLEQVKYIVSTWRQPDNQTGTSMLVLIEIEH